MRTSKTKNIMLQWHTGHPTESGTYLVAMGRIEDGRFQPHVLYPVQTLAYSARYQAWNWYDYNGTPDDAHMRLWDDVLAWASIDALATSLAGWPMDRG